MTGAAVGVESPIRVVHRDGDRFDVAIGPFGLSVDQPVGAGGDGTAPTPTELFVASLAACQAFYAQRFMRRHDIEGDVAITCRWEMARDPARVGRVRILLETPEVPIDLRQRLVKVVEHCTVHNSLLHPPEVVLELKAEDLSAAS